MTVISDGTSVSIRDDARPAADQELDQNRENPVAATPIEGHVHSAQCSHQHHHHDSDGHHHHHHPNGDHSHPAAADGSATPPSSFRVPTRAILTKEDLERFQASETHREFVDFILRLNEASKGRTLRQEYHQSQVVSDIIHVLDTFEQYCSQIPAQGNLKSRFGNPAFKDWYDLVSKNIQELTGKFIPAEANAEVSSYLLLSFGNRKRIDYGTGHEANFICFLFCLEKIGLITSDDYPAVVFRAFWRYILLMRSLQQAYWLEPAGSHGVWGLDDYHFLPFLFGSAQLTDHRHIRPKSIHDPDILEQFSKDYMYLACIDFINSVKTESLRWNSPMLDDISGVKKWSKVNEGMIKMYRAEVLNKLPIMQHFRFGSLIQFEASGPIPHDDEIGNDHVHAFGMEHPTCCGLRVPSAFGAALEKKTAGALRKPIPFD
ncbi:uncharacterized protein BJ171DRAFT_514718 [Polychytrium aggregatum]|uniref:uncharacterized protein n=1 Tax=Polychytrium aggregatum TaxID=110093 RepID=UPI0022FE986D|nr:uncharacterized protein BJ171DRAFT_514718 [Polychytrium aggregatum]KAI9202325.1 hypothetical protein BJ171DRAFT_514718 [Polychytrium aggregatum]